jgi:hypothetical protein
MRYTITLILAIVSFSFLSFNFDNKVYIPSVGDNWKSQVDSAIDLIKRVDIDKYDSLVKYCDSVDFMIGTFSTTKPPHMIIINTGDLKLNSVDNLAAVLVHESRHLYYYDNHIIMSSDSEELHCYQYENDFLNHLDYVEDWLYKNNIQQIIYYSNKLNCKK